MAAKEATAEIIDRINEKIRIFLPSAGDEENVEQVETVIVNGKTTIIKRGEYVDVPFDVFEALYNSGRYPRL